MVPAVVFDLDGTLVDSAPDLVATLNTIFAREGLPPVAYEAARNMVGGGARLMIERGLKAEGRTLPAAEVDRLCRDFIEHYAAHIADRSRLFPGVEAALDEIAAHGSTLIVCTNKLEWLSVRLLDALGLSKRFAVIRGAILKEPFGHAPCAAGKRPVGFHGSRSRSYGCALGIGGRFCRPIGGI